MLKLALVLSLVVAGLLGVTGIAGGVAAIAELVFLILVVLLVGYLVLDATTTGDGH
jgi:uncharacterized membrane protein YtjA (UPF0391 family)